MGTRSSGSIAYEKIYNNSICGEGLIKMYL